MAMRKETQRLGVSLLHENRIVYRYDVRAEGVSVFTPVYLVGATKEGVPFASGDDPAEVHRQRRARHLDGGVQGPDLLRLLQRLPRCLPGRAGKVHQGIRGEKEQEGLTGRPAGLLPSAPPRVRAGVWSLLSLASAKSVV